MVLRRWESIAGNLVLTTELGKKADEKGMEFFHHPSQVKNSIPFSQFLRLRRLCSDDSDFSEKVGHHRAQQINRQSALQAAEKDNTDQIPGNKRQWNLT